MGDLEQTASLAKEDGIGQDGRRLRDILEKSQKVFADTGRYQGIADLEIKNTDPVRYEKIWSRLRGALVGARDTALNISASPIVREIGELCFALYTPEGDSITVSTGIIAHVHTMSDTIKFMVNAGYEDNPGIAPGDIFVNNDTHCGDVHNADVMEILPIFWEGELVGWAAGVTHEIDVGAPQPSSMPQGNVSRFEDGWILSCQKVGTNDRIFADYERRCHSAVRMPFYWVMDEKCRIAGCQLIRDAVLRLIREEGLDTYRRITREFIEDMRRSFIARIREMLVPGVYEVPSFLDLTHSMNVGRMPDYAAIDTLNHAPLVIRVGVDASFGVDLDGANKWGYHSSNCTPSSLQAGFWVGLSQILAYHDKLNDGAYLATTFNIPYGTWAHPDDPYVSNTRSWGMLIPAFTGLFRATGQALVARGYLEEVVAGYPGGNTMQGGGPNHYGKQGAWTNFEMSSHGTSAGMVRDGEHSCAAVINPEGDMGDVEAWELLEPLLYLGRRLRPSSAGLGKYRGGSGFESIRMVYNTPYQLIFNGGNGHLFHGNGLFGGYPGNTLYRHSIKDTDLKDRIAKGLPYPVADGDPEASEMTALSSGTHVRDQNMWHPAEMHHEYDLYLSLQCGGHGCGDVLERDPQRVIDDLNGAIVLPRFAESAYGVIATKEADGKWQLDAEATVARRRAIREQRLARSTPVEEWLEKQRPIVEKADYIEPVRRMYRESLALSRHWGIRYRKFWNLPEDWTI